MSSIVKLVPINKELHARYLYVWRTDPEINRFMYSPGPSTFEEHLHWLERIKDDQTHLRFVIEHGIRPVGTAAFVSIDSRHQRADFDMYVGDPMARLRGAGAAAEFQMLDHGFHVLNLHKISCEVFTPNEAAIRMHLRMGFSREGVFRDHALLDTGWSDVTRLSILREEWNVSRQKLSLALSKLIPSNPLIQS